MTLDQNRRVIEMKRLIEENKKNIEIKKPEKENLKKDLDKFENDKINKILKNKDFYNKLHEQRHGEEGLFIGFVDIQKLNYNDFVSYELFIKLTTCYSDDSDDGHERVCGKTTMFDNVERIYNPHVPNVYFSIPPRLIEPGPGNNSYYDDSYVENCYLSKLKILNPEIFLSNVNIKWKMLQLAKKDTSIQIQTTKPSPKNSPTKPKSQSPSKKSPPKPSPKKPSPKKPSPKKLPPKKSPPKQKTYNWDNTDNPTRPPPEYKPSKDFKWNPFKS